MLNSFTLNSNLHIATIQLNISVKNPNCRSCKWLMLWDLIILDMDNFMEFRADIYKYMLSDKIRDDNQFLRGIRMNCEHAAPKKSYT